MRFESRWWRLAGSKDTVIRDELDLAPTRYQLLHQLAAREDALASYPALVNRLRPRMKRPRRWPTIGKLNLN